MKLSHIIEQRPRDWKTTSYQNVALTVFHTQNIFHHMWKTPRTHSDVLMFEKQFKTMGQICLIISPNDWRQIMQCNVVLTVFHTW